METLLLAGFVESELSRIAINRNTFNENDLQTLWKKVICKDVEGEAEGWTLCDEVFFASADQSNSSELNIHFGGWTVQLSEGFVKSSITAALLGGLLAIGRFPALPALVLPAVLPIVFDLKKVRLTIKEREIHATLTLQDTVSVPGKDVTELYQRLPPDVQMHLNELDFREFLEKCRLAGMANIHSDDSIEILPSNKATFRITIQ